MTQPANRRLATEQYVADEVGAAPFVTSVVGATGAVTGTQIAADPALRAAFGLSVVATVTASAALAVGKFTPADATTGALTMTLPTGAADGTTIGVEKIDATANSVTLTGNIRGVPASTINLAWQHETLLLRADSAGSWWPVAGHKTKVALDAAYEAKVSRSGATTGQTPALQGDGTMAFTTPGTPSQLTYTASHTLVANDANNVVVINSTSATTVTVPQSTTVNFSPETVIIVRQYGTGVVSVAPANGSVTVHTPSGTLSTGGQYTSLMLTKVGTDEWICESTAPPSIGIAQKYVVGRSIFPQQYFPNASDTGIVEGNMVGTPIFITQRQHFDAITCRPFNAGTAGALVRLGLYADNGSEDPGSLLVDAGTFDGTVATVEAALAINVTLDPGLYWLACAWQNTGTAPTTRTALVGQRGVIGGPGIYTRRAADAGYAFPLRTSVPGALPATFAADDQWRAAYRIGLRVGT